MPFFMQLRTFRHTGVRNQVSNDDLFVWKRLELYRKFYYVLDNGVASTELHVRPTLVFLKHIRQSSLVTEVTAVANMNL